MRSLLYSSVLLGALLFGCAGLKNKTVPTVISDATPSFLSQPTFEYSFRANIDGYGNSVSGILILKKITTQQYRLVLLNEFGARMLDGTLNKERWVLHNALPPFHNNKLRKQVFTDFKHLLHESVNTTKATLRVADDSIHIKRLDGTLEINLHLLTSPTHTHN